MKNLKEILLEYVGVSKWSTGSTWDTAGKDSNAFKKLALSLQDRNYDRVKDSLQEFCDELQKHKDVTIASRRPGSSPKGKFAIGVAVNDTDITLKLKFDRRVKFIVQSRKSCEAGTPPFSDWESRGGAVDVWAQCQIILSIDEDSPLVDEMEEFAYNGGILGQWVKSFN